MNYDGVSFTFDGDTFDCIGITIATDIACILFCDCLLVHGFEQVKYEVFEGETLNITFKRNVKGITHHRRLPLSGSITSTGDETGKS